MARRTTRRESDESDSARPDGTPASAPRDDASIDIPSNASTTERSGGTRSKPRPVRDCLVAVVTNDDDLRRFRDEGWYRLPRRALGRQIAGDALDEITAVAIYQTERITDGIAGSIELWGEIDGIDMMTRGEMIPTESEHPAADEPYVRLRVRGIQSLSAPLVNRRPRRLTFLRTTRERLLGAESINDLIIGTRSQEKLHGALREAGVEMERKIYMQVSDAVVEVDFGLVLDDRQLGLFCSEDDRDDPLLAKHGDGGSNGVSLMRFSPERVENDLERCLREIMDVVSSIRQSTSVGADE